VIYPKIEEVKEKAKNPMEIKVKQVSGF